MPAFKILSIGANKPTSRGPVIEIQVEELSTHQHSKLSVFLNDAIAFPYKAGDEISCEPRSKEFPAGSGKYSHSVGFENIGTIAVKSESPQPGAAEPTVPPEVWAKKDLRIARQNALRHAVEIVKMSLKQADAPPTTDAIVQSVESIAWELVNWIYYEADTDSKTERIPF